MNNDSFNKPDYVKTCRKCGRFFNYPGFGSILCNNCRAIDQRDFLLVRDYIYANGTATASEVSSATGISEPQITRYLREGRLEIPDGSVIYIPCEKCGTDIRSGRLCQDCARTLSASMKAEMNFDDAQIGDKPTPVATADKLHIRGMKA